MTKLNLAHGLQFEDLYHQEGLKNIDRLFLESLPVELSNKIRLLRANPQELSQKETSELLIILGEKCEDFINEVFALTSLCKNRHDKFIAFEQQYKFKRAFIQRQAIKKYSQEIAVKVNGQALVTKLEALMGTHFTENAFIKLVQNLQESKDSDNLDLAMQYGAWACFSDQGQQIHKDGFLFILSEKIDHEKPFPIEHTEGTHRVPKNHQLQRDGFKLTNKKLSDEQVLDQVHYCIKCHPQDKDTCSKGIAGEILKSGCPLGVKISEMNVLQQAGMTVAALAMIMIDNPMLAATGDRICNDCMKSCIFQKQTPVNVPSIETAILDQVLGLPWGFEIYGLLSRWNPLNFISPYPSVSSGKTVLVVGMGPAGFTLAHHLLNDGHQVLAIDALKIHPLDDYLRQLNPIYKIEDYFAPLDRRDIAGFGGVAEYGITVRWDKNYLLVLRILLERRAQFYLFGGIRFGSQITMDQTTEMGIDHVAVCAGAGQPQIPKIKNLFAKGVRFASDFLMSLQLTGANRRFSPSNLQVRMPIAVIGAGLTAIDTATEALAYYVFQVEHFLERYEQLAMNLGHEKLRESWNEEEQIIADEFLDHALAIKAERTNAELESRPANFHHLLDKWGGAKVIYRKDLQKSPSFRLNHEELFKAMQEGVQFVANCIPCEIELDLFGHAKSLHVSKEGKELEISARSIFIAIGTKPNSQTLVDGIGDQSIETNGFFVNGQKTISIHGDLHQDYAGSVVKAMASAKNSYPLITKSLKQKPAGKYNSQEIHQLLENSLQSYIHEIRPLTDRALEIIVKAPSASRNFKPGQFFRLQNYPSSHLPYSLEGIALTGASVDRKQGLLSLIVLLTGSSSYLSKYLKKGEPVVVMGPTGAPTEIVKNQNVILFGGGLGNAVLFSIAEALKQTGCQLIYFAAYKTTADIFKQKSIEKYADSVIWCLEDLIDLPQIRPKDQIYHGRVTDALKAYANNKLDQNLLFKIEEADRFISIGSDQMMAAIQFLKQSELAGKTKSNLVSIASINSPMQCMMKEVCGQCIQRHVHPETGEEKFVFSCVNQDQDAHYVDFNNLNQRLNQNSLLEKLSYQWTLDNSKLS